MKGWGQIAVFAALAIGSGAAVWRLDGEAVALASLLDALALMATVAPIVLGAMLVAGYAQTLLPQALIARWLGAESGLRGLLLATVAGMITPGGPFASFALVAGMARTGADIGACLTYLTAWSVLGLHRLLMWELPLLGVDLSVLRYVSSVPLPLLVGLLSRVLVRRFGVHPLPRDF